MERIKATEEMDFWFRKASGLEYYATTYVHPKTDAAREYCKKFSGRNDVEVINHDDLEMLKKTND